MVIPWGHYLGNVPKRNFHLAEEQPDDDPHYSCSQGWSWCIPQEQLHGSDAFLQQNKKCIQRSSWKVKAIAGNGEQPSCVRGVRKKEYERSENIPIPLNLKAVVVSDQTEGDYYRVRDTFSASRVLTRGIKNKEWENSFKETGLKH